MLGRWISDKPELEARRLVMYCGTIGRVNGVDYLVDVAESAAIDEPELAFVVVGDGSESESVRERAIAKGVLNRNFFMYPPEPKTRMPAVMEAANALTSLVIDLPELEANSANKFFDAMSVGRPILINYGGWQAALLNESNAGLRLPRNPKEAGKLIIDLLGDADTLAEMGQNARALGETRFSREAIVSLVADEIERVAEGHLYAKTRRRRASYTRKATTGELFHAANASRHASKDWIS